SPSGPARSPLDWSMVMASLPSAVVIWIDLVLASVAPGAMPSRRISPAAVVGRGEGSRIAVPTMAGPWGARAGKGGQGGRGGGVVEGGGGGREAGVECIEFERPAGGGGGVGPWGGKLTANRRQGQEHFQAPGRKRVNGSGVGPPLRSAVRRR